jgi:hypothetical protein
VTASSVVNKGTIVTVWLPVIQSDKVHDNQLMDVVKLRVPGSLEEPVGNGPATETTMDSTSPGIRAVRAMFQQLHGSAAATADQVVCPPCPSSQLPVALPVACHLQYCHLNDSCDLHAPSPSPCLTSSWTEHGS